MFGALGNEMKLGGVSLLAELIIEQYMSLAKENLNIVLVGKWSIST